MNLTDPTTAFLGGLVLGMIIMLLIAIICDTGANPPDDYLTS